MPGRDVSTARSYYRTAQGPEPPGPPACEGVQGSLGAGVARPRPADEPSDALALRAASAVRGHEPGKRTDRFAGVPADSFGGDRRRHLRPESGGSADER